MDFDTLNKMNCPIPLYGTNNYTLFLSSLFWFWFVASTIIVTNEQLFQAEHQLLKGLLCRATHFLVTLCKRFLYSLKRDSTVFAWWSYLRLFTYERCIPTFLPRTAGCLSSGPQGNAGAVGRYSQPSRETMQSLHIVLWYWVSQEIVCFPHSCFGSFPFTVLIHWSRVLTCCAVWVTRS